MPDKDVKSVTMSPKKKYQNPRLMFLEVLLWISLQLFVSINSVTPAFNHVTHVLHQHLLVHRYTSNKSHNISFFYVSSVNFKLWSTNSIKQENAKGHTKSEDTWELNRGMSESKGLIRTESTNIDLSIRTELKTTIF